jgi:formylglycine-generating enzyme required for sulfatase activity/disulfide oxidoreductase YuzD
MISPALLAGSPEIILPKTKIIHPMNWYAEQSSNWREETARNRNNPQAWVNYFVASRYAQQPAGQLNQIVHEMEEAVPGTFELLLVQGWNEGFSSKSYELLNRAFALKPEDASSYSSLLLLNELFLNRQDRKTFGNRLFESGLVSGSLLNYSYNVLMSLDKDAVLFTEGDNTTIPIFILQDIMNVRDDVIVLNLDMLLEPSYRNQKLNQTDIKLTGFDGFVTRDPKKLLCSTLPFENPDKKFYYALTLSKENIDPIKDQLYVVGLASRLSKERLDNIAIIKENLEKRFLLDYLAVDFNGENELAAGKVLNSNYLVPMILLNDHYVKDGNLEESKRLQQIVIKLAGEGGKTELINHFLHRNEGHIPSFVLAELKMKELEESFKPIKGNLYAQRTEATNEQYNLFLNFLRQTNPDLYSKYAFDLSSYQEPALAFMTMYHAPREATRKNKYYSQYPAVNLSYESVVAYCEWLTGQYNNNPDKKFKKVKFRLPTIKEWQIAALGYKKFQSWNIDENNIEVGVPANTTDELSKQSRTIPFKGSDILYPWYRAYNYRNKYLNRFECALGNFKCPEKMTTCMTRNKMITPDGFVMAGPVAQYFPNDMGFFDVVGNVAEMTEEKGKACGGSWNHAPLESTIVSINSYSRPDAAIGFRIFMEVIEP